MKVVVFSGHQLATDTYIGNLREKLFEVKADRSVLVGRLAETEGKLKGNEYTLKEVQDQLEVERTGAVVLQSSLDEMKSYWEAKKEKAVGEAVAAYLQSEAFNDEAIKFFISGFETLCCWVLRAHPNLDLLMFKADVESNFVGPKPAQEAEEELERDDATS